MKDSVTNVDLTPEVVQAMMDRQKPRVSVCRWCNKYPRTILWMAKACPKCTQKIANTLAGLFPYYKERIL